MDYFELSESEMDALNMSVVAWGFSYQVRDRPPARPEFDGYDFFQQVFFQKCIVPILIRQLYVILQNLESKLNPSNSGKAKVIENPRSFTVILNSDPEHSMKVMLEVTLLLV